MRSALGLCVLITLPAVLAVASCEDEPAAPGAGAQIEFVSSELDLGEARTGEVTVRNTGDAPGGPVHLTTSAVRDEGGGLVPGSELRVTPSVLPGLDPGESALIQLALTLPSGLQSGNYGASVDAQAGEFSALRATLSVRFTVQVSPPNGGGGSGIVIESGPTEIRQGDVVEYHVQTESGTPVADESVAWSVRPTGSGFFGTEGRFVAYEPEALLLVAQVGDEVDSLVVQVTARGLDGSLTEVGRGSIPHRNTSDLWVHGRYAYTGTHGSRIYEGQTFRGNTLYTWDVSEPSSPTLVDSVMVDAGTVNDVKVRADGGLAVITHEHSSDDLNGITILDLADPAHPEPIARYTQGLESGVHNVWIEGDRVYVVADGEGGLQIVDISQPDSPSTAATFYSGFSFLHDVYVRNGLAFLSHWDAGLIVLDVGNGIAGGSPENPVELSRVQTAGGNTHNAWYWPEGGYVFVGEENFGKPGVMHVVDFRNPEAPTEVATFEVTGATPHNFWMDEDRDILYAAWYGRGLRVLDVSGELLGDLSRQGREITSIRYADASTYTWAPQLHEGLVYASDLTVGLVVLEPGF